MRMIQSMNDTEWSIVMNDLGTKALGLIHDPAVVRRIYIITLVTAMVVLAVAVKGPEQKGRLIADDRGHIVGIRRNSLSSSERYDLRLRIDEGGEMALRDVTLTIQAVRDGSGSKAAENKDERQKREAEIDAEIDSMLSEIEYSDQKTVRLPSRLADGTSVSWTRGEKKDRTNLILIPLVYAALIAAVIKSGLDTSDNGEKEMQREILRGLPRFCNQLFLMMNAGMILSDAFERICSSYREFGEDSMTPFQRELADICDENRDHRISTAAVITGFAEKHNVKEMIRIATILTENEKRGSDVVESLSRESKYLWNDRKIIARECGKMIDTRMSYPMGMLLVLLIVITMAPALLSM